MGLALSLPYPPSINHYWVRNRFGGVRVSDAGKVYRAAVVDILRKLDVERLDGRLALHMRINPPDARRRDIDNVLKASLDALTHGGAYADDQQIDWQLTERGDIDREYGGSAEVTIEDLAHLVKCDHCRGTGWKPKS